MPKNTGDTEQFSLEEIIAEIKSEAGEKRPPLSATHKQAEIIEMPEEVKIFDIPPVAPPHRELSTKPAANAVKPDAYAEDMGKSEGKRMAPEKKTRAQLIFEEEERIASEDKRRHAPWRTEGKKTDKKEHDTQEFEITLEIESGEVIEESEPRQASAGPGYDFINQRFADAGAAVRALDKRMISIAMRILLLLPLLVVASYMTACLPLGLPMPFGFTYFAHPFLYLFVFAAMHTAAIIISSDVTAAGLMRALRLRPSMDSLTLFCQLCVLAHNISIIIKPEWGGWLPYTCVGIFTCLIAMVAKRQRAESLRRTYRATLLGTVPAAVKLTRDGDLDIAVKTEEGAYVDVEELAVRDPTERLSRYFAPLAMALTVALAVSASFGQGRAHTFFWCLAAVASVASPASLLLSSSMPVRRISKKLFTSGSGLINPARTAKLAKSTAVVLRDGDVFPVGAVEISGMKIAGTQRMETVLGSAAAVAQEIGGGLSRAMLELARRQYVPPMRAANLRFYESGGISAEVDGKYVLMGSASFLMRMGVSISEGVKLQNSIFVAIDGIFAGIFSVKYGVQPQPYAAFRVLRSVKLLPILALRDINTTQAFVESRYELRADSTEYPELLERIRLSEPGFGGKGDTLAFISRDGMLPFAEAIAAAKKQRRALRFNLTIGLAAMLAGMLLMYFLVFNMKVSSATPTNVMLYLLLWLVPTCLGSSMLTQI